ncbi:tRNA modification GTPase MSS1, mitochondrial [Pseudocercospora fuligena]|uniref:tRNA modification GTPase MSS1, mitochondrial n=1 Tax=Pseudocercospora fuligena TaxID=685502 RepID=A0A8H6R7G8_9PEZI|nr:tRNA modification GTPase MSS1, mitochondrial [Pseudocercospora fuligena]
MSRDTVLDSSALVLYFPAPRTATGDDILELHVHGGPAIVKAVLGAISRCRSKTSPIRYAEPGEFTRRAFMNSRLDLTQVEALGDTLAADTEQQRRLSVRGTTGHLAKQYEKWREMLLYARGELEALIDFSEDQHFDESPNELMDSVAQQVKVLQQALRIHSQNAVRGELLRHGISIALLGAPNAGKSSLLNRIVGREAAIVSNEAGTTRDIVEVGVDIGGYFCRFGDTAGLRQAMKAAVQGEQGRSPEVINRIEQEGMRRAKERAADSDLVIVVFSFEDTSKAGLLPKLNLDAEVTAVAKKLILEKDNVVIILNKSDLVINEPERAEAKRAVLKEFPSLNEDSVHLLSCTDAETTSSGQLQSDVRSAGTENMDPGGIQAFLAGLIRQFEKLTAALAPVGDDGASAGFAPAADADLSIWQESLGASERHRVLLEECVSHVNAFLREARSESLIPVGARDGDFTRDEVGEAEADIVVAAEHLRAAAECLGKITGRGQAGDVEEVLGVVFEKFCVGK